MNKTVFREFFRPIILFFILINALCITFSSRLNTKGIDSDVLIIGNLILFLLTIIACFIHIRALKNNNAYAFVRGITLASFLKLIIIAISVAMYFTIAEKHSVYAVAIVMAFYIVYAIFEVRGAMKLNRERNAKN
ncbi:MAG: hypothetical protein JO072_14245 [Parafilimonas sp.]|nr:hypothetical protein [Parafilimonas sp.]